MLRNQAGPPAGGSRGRGLTPRADRRRLPIGRAATLTIGARTHIVGLSDLSASGAYLITSAPAGEGEQHALQLFALPGRAGLVVQARVVRVVKDGVERDHHPCGLAVEFVGLDEAGRSRVESFVRAGRLR